MDLISWEIKINEINLERMIGVQEEVRGFLLPDTFHPNKKMQNYIQLGLVRNYAKGETVVFPGEIINKVIYVLAGRLSVSFLNEDGRQKLMYSAGKYSVVDRLFTFENCFVHVVAEKASSVCFLDKEQLFSIFRQDEEVMNDFILNYSSKCFHFMSEAKEMALYNPSVRVLRLLYELGVSEGKLFGNACEINVRLAQKSISEITGVHYVTISKIFRWLKKEGILHKTTYKITVNDLERLKELINANIQY
ncbi:MAG: Crp/Fnr family transcriptional regulator [Desulfitobacterium sp.]